MKIIHIASFKGNIGDIINHEGFYSMLKKYFKHEMLHIKKVEIRDFYFLSPERCAFDRKFADYINSFDLCILGGGSFFDLQWNESSTGTTFNFKEEFIDELKIPILVNGMGYHEFPRLTNDSLCSKFRKFILDVGQRSNWLITLRNDGSFERILNRYGNDFSKYIIKVPDHGFFCSFNQKSNTKSDIVTIGMCISNDLFSKAYNKNIKYKDFNKYIAELIEDRCKLANNIILFPHTPQDINTINEIFKSLSSESKRSKVIVAPYNSSGPEAVQELCSYYLRCDCIVGMRFHSLVTAVNLNIPAIALCGHIQIEALFKELNFDEFSIKADNLEFKHMLSSMIDNVIFNKEEIKRKYIQAYKELDKLEKEYQNAIKNFLK